MTGNIGYRSDLRLIAHLQPVLDILIYVPFSDPSTESSRHSESHPLSLSTDFKTGLFATTIAAFIIGGYKCLSSDSGAATALLLLNQISSIAATLRAIRRNADPSPAALQRLVLPAARHGVRTTPQHPLVLQLALSLICALAATLMQQWARRYLQLARAQTTLNTRLSLRGRAGVRLSQTVEVVPAFLHVAVFLFF